MIKYLIPFVSLLFASLAQANIFMSTGMDSLVGAMPAKAIEVQKRLLIENELKSLNDQQRAWIETNFTAEKFEQYLEQYLNQQMGKSKLQQITSSFGTPIATKVKMLERQASSPTRKSAILAYRQQLEEQSAKQTRLLQIQALVKLTGAYRLLETMDNGLREALGGTKTTASWKVKDTDIVDYYLYTLRTISDQELDAYLNIYRQPLQRDFIVIVERAIKNFFVNASANIDKLKTPEPVPVTGSLSDQ